MIAWFAIATEHLVANLLVCAGALGAVAAIASIVHLTRRLVAAARRRGPRYDELESRLGLENFGGYRVVLTPRRRLIRMVPTGEGPAPGSFRFETKKAKRSRSDVELGAATLNRFFKLRHVTQADRDYLHFNRKRFQKAARFIDRRGSLFSSISLRSGEANFVYWNEHLAGFPGPWALERHLLEMLAFVNVFNSAVGAPPLVSRERARALGEKMEGEVGAVPAEYRKAPVRGQPNYWIENPGDAKPTGPVSLEDLIEELHAERITPWDRVAPASSTPEQLNWQRIAGCEDLAFLFDSESTMGVDLPRKPLPLAGWFDRVTRLLSGRPLAAFITAVALAFIAMTSEHTIARSKTVFRSISWPNTLGAVTATKVKDYTVRNCSSSGSRPSGQTCTESTYYAGVITYSYHVDGRRYESSRYGVQETSMNGFKTPDDAKIALGPYQKGAPVTVHYDPVDPSLAALQTGVTDASNFWINLTLSYLMPWFGIVAWLVVMLRGASQLVRTAFRI